MWGAIVLLFLFLLINRDSSAVLESLADHARHRLSGDGAEVVVAVIIAAAVGSALLMIFWPQWEQPRQYHVFRHYCLVPDGHREQAPAVPARRAWNRLYFAAVNYARRWAQASNRTPGAQGYNNNRNVSRSS